MIDTKLIDELSFKIRKLTESSPAKDIEHNLHALIQGALSKFELVRREEYDIQVQVLEKTQAKLAALETKLDALEANSNKGN